MVFDQNYPFGAIKGTFHVSKADAKELFNFDMKSTAIGVCIYKRKDKWVIRNVPKCGWVSKKVKSHRNRFRLLLRIFKECNFVLSPIWSRYSMPSNLSFVRENLPRLKNYTPFIRGLIISKGDLDRPKIKHNGGRSIIIENNVIKFKLKNKKPGYEVGAIVIDRVKGYKIYAFDKKEYESEEILLRPKEKIESKTPYVYVFFYYKGEYSYSIREEARWQK